ETAHAVRDAAQALRDAGATVTEARPDGVEQAFGLFGGLLGADDGANVMRLLGMIGTTEPSPLLLGVGGVLHRFAVSTAELAGLLLQFDMWRAQQLGFLANFDAVLSPVSASPAIEHGTSLAEETLAGFSYAM